MQMGHRGQTRGLGSIEELSPCLRVGGGEMVGRPGHLLLDHGCSAPTGSLIGRSSGGKKPPGICDSTGGFAA
jgi:hypothetical protein